MQDLNILIVFVLAYLAGSIPFGLLVVRLINGKDVRSVGSGRTGGTNAFRAAGVAAGVLTGIGDILKGVASGWIASLLVPGVAWVRVVAAVLAIIGHNYSVFLLEKDENNQLRFRGGAGGATCLGGAIALWPDAWMVILPIGALIYFFIGYASVTTISAAVVSTIIFTVRAINGLGPWEYILYGVLSLAVVLWALRPNLKRLVEGTERMVGIRACLMKNQGPPVAS